MSNKTIDAITQRQTEARKRATPVRNCPGFESKELPDLHKNLPLRPPEDPSCWILGPNGMVSAWMDINYDRAMDCLVANINNRRMYEHTVQRYTRAMLQGMWAEHHQGIAFNVLGELIDAQHRLEAIARTGLSYYMLVTWNVPILAQITIDDHKIRSFADAAKVDGNKEINEGLVATAKRMEAGLRPSSTMSKKEMNWWLAAFKDGLYFAESCFPGPHRKGITVAPVKAVLARAYYAASAQRNRIEQFANILYHGRADKPGIPGTQSAIALHDKLRSPGRSFIREGHKVYAMTERMLRYFLDEADRSNVRSTEDELFELLNLGPQLAAAHLATEEEAAINRLAVAHPVLA
jgi:hypothetical protein